MNPIRKAVIGAALIGTTLTGGALGAVLVNGSASAADDPSSTTTAPAATAPADTQPAAPAAPDGRGHGGNFDPTKGGHQANGITETLLTGDTAEKVKAA